MARITIEDCLNKVNNRFIIVHMSNQRTRQLLKGSKPLVNTPENRHIVTSLREVAQEKVYLEEETIEALKGGGYINPVED